MSTKKRLKKLRWKKWSRNLVILLLPGLLAFLQVLQSSLAHGHILPTIQDLTFALGALYSATLTSLIDWAIKFKETEH